VAAAKRKGISFKFRRFADRLHERSKGTSIDDSYILIELVQAAEEIGVAVEVDRSNRPEPTIPSTTSNGQKPRPTTPPTRLSWIAYLEHIWVGALGDGKWRTE
jgi:hypothetical protein